MVNHEYERGGALAYLAAYDVHQARVFDRGLIRVLDLVFVRKHQDGAVAVVGVADLDGDGTFDLATFTGASSGLLLKGRCRGGRRCVATGEFGRDPHLREPVGRTDGRGTAAG